MSRDFEQILRQIVSLRVKTLSNTNLVVPRHIKKKKANFWLTSVAQNPIDFECEDREWDSDYGNHFIIVFDWYEGHRGVVFE